MGSLSLAKRPFLTSFGIFIYGTSAYVGYHAFRIWNLPKPSAHSYFPENQENKEKTFDSFTSNQRDYDREIEWEEFLLGIGSLRKRLCQSAKGKVLEVASGTGRNFEYFIPREMKSLTLSEKSRTMLEKALIKFRSLKIREGFNSASCKVEFKLAESQKLPFPDKEFDSLVQTFGLCSMHDPVQSLREMKRVVKNDGVILLLEHGRSYYNWLNLVLDKTANSHSERWGCFYNRDIIKICEQAELKVESVERFHLGTSYIIKCRPLG
jgi:methyltransferase OMS1